MVSRKQHIFLIGYSLVLHSSSPEAPASSLLFPCSSSHNTTKVFLSRLKKVVAIQASIFALKLVKRLVWDTTILLHVDL